MPRRRSPDLLIVTKLHRPAVDTTWVPRPRLLARLDEGLRTRVALLAAPAGFGKTTLAAQWLDRCPRRAAWLALDERDGDPERFLRYVLASLRTAVPGGGASLDRLLRGIQVPPPAYLAEVLVADLAALVEPVVLVLDDYQALTAEAVQQILCRLVEHLPEQLHLVLLTRVDPAWPLGKWRARQWLTELRAADLAFSREEAQAFFARHPAPPLTADAVALLHQRTEGWVAGLQLAQVSLEHVEDPERFARDFSGSDRLIVDFLMDEVIGRHPLEVRDFLAVTALFDRFCVPLCDAVLGDAPGRQPSRHLLEQLERENLFLVPLDHDRRWYRYHHLFQGLLLRHLPELAAPERRAVIHRRAADWFAREGLIEEAIRHYVSAGDVDAAAALVEAHLHAVLDADISRRTLMRWLAMFPPSAEKRRPALLVAHAYRKIVSWDFVGLVSLLDEAEALLRDRTCATPETQRQSLLGDIDMQRAFYLYWQGDAEGALRHAQRAQRVVPKEHGYTYGSAIVYGAGAHAISGRREEALRLLTEALTENCAVGSRNAAQYLMACAAIRCYAGDWDAVEQTANHILSIHATVPQSEYWYGYAHYFIGRVAYERNLLDTAAEHFARGEQMRYLLSTRLSHACLIGLARVALAQGKVEAAQAYAGSARRFAVEVKDAYSMQMSVSFEIRMGFLSREAPAKPTAPPSTMDSNQFWLEVPSLTHAEYLVSKANPSDCRAGLQCIENALEKARQHHNTGQAIQFLAAKAVALEAADRRDEALAVLDGVLLMAEPLGFVRTFVDRGPRMAELLRLRQAERDPGAYVRLLLEAFAGRSPSESPRIPSPQEERDGMPPGQAEGTVSGGLSLRELGVLRLLEQGFSNKEIADQLFVSLETARKHTGNIYRKLGVHKRTQAVAAARRLGLFASK
ncbi:MAG TPA: LuxR C-terminal-related transcriptional regulator [Candidatus Methylomirabilis sp.]|nr:LuxR C-terminal-related transcriptional regulator [Candidatus Methylomirabilis sp.]